MKRLTITGPTLGDQIEKAVATMAQEKGPILMSGRGEGFTWSLGYGHCSVTMTIEEPAKKRKRKTKEAA